MPLRFSCLQVYVVGTAHVSRKVCTACWGSSHGAGKPIDGATLLHALTGPSGMPVRPACTSRQPLEYATGRHHACSCLPRLLVPQAVQDVSSLIQRVSPATVVLELDAEREKKLLEQVGACCRAV